MSSRTARKLVGYAPDGTEVSLTTSGGYDYAGIVRSAGTGKWSVVEKGWSLESVQARTKTTYGRVFADAKAAVMLFEETAPAVAEYFGHHAVFITGYWIPGQPEQTGRHLKAGRSVIRDLAARGAVQISFQPLAGGQLIGAQTINLRGSAPADFMVDVMLRSMKTRRPHVPMCATAGHGAIPATHTISYRDARDPGHEVTVERTCTPCTDSYSRRPVLKDFKAEELHTGKAK